MSDPTPVTRLAPSPTGALHLGNARTFLVNWALARQRGWRILLRVEDLEHPRVDRSTIDRTRSELRQLGLDWDDEAPLQSTDIAPCHEALDRLGARGLIYPCSRTRADLAAAAPNEGDGARRAPASLRPPGAGAPVHAPRRDCTWRLMVKPGVHLVQDAVAGEHRIDVAEDCGDFPLWTRRGVPSYQLAVTIDDARQGVDQVVRGDDLIPSAARQQLLRNLLDLPQPIWWHLPLLRGPDGRRLAKRHGDTRVARWLDAGPERLIGLLATFSGLGDDPRPMATTEFAERFDIDRLPRRDVIVTADHIAWLDA